jgi:predicted nucleic acid-binding protein
MAFFLDTNIVCYAVASGSKQAAAAALVALGPVISIQTLNEFSLVARRKWGCDWPMIGELVENLLASASELRPLDLPTHDKGRELAERHQLNVYDAMIVSAALLAGCEMLYSEDIQDGMIIEDRMIIRNPFPAA